MPTPPIPDAEHQARLDAWQQALDEGCKPGSSRSPILRAAELIGMSPHTYKSWLRRARDRGDILDEPVQTAQTGRHRDEPVFFVDTPPDPTLPAEELWERAERVYSRYSAHEEGRKLVDIKLDVQGPWGWLWLGDPHVGARGTDHGLLRAHMALAQTEEAIWLGNIGDSWDAWEGRLAHLWREESLSEAEAVRMLRWFIAEGGHLWLVFLDGNHDLWRGVGNPANFDLERYRALHLDNEAQVRILHNEQETYFAIAHGWPGSSMWNPAHGPARAAQMRFRYHVVIGGHIHKAGYNILSNEENGVMTHAVQLGSYKRHDTYARGKGLPKQNWAPSCLIVVNPDLPDTSPAHITVHWDPDEGAEYLRGLRARWKERQAA